jgi:hypothetical protein
MKIIAFISILCLGIFPSQDKKRSENQEITFNVQNFDKVRIHNYRGDVKIQASTGSTMQIDIVKNVWGKTDNSINKGFEEVKLDSTIVDGEFIIFINTPYKHFKIDNNGNSYYQSEDWENWNKKKIKEPEYKFEFQMTIKLPADKMLYAATHWEDMEVKGMNSNLTVKNHHGDIDVVTNSDNLVIETHHGDIKVENASRNVANGVFKTHHGDINTSFPTLSAAVFMDTYHGDLYTDFDYSLEPTLINTSKKKNKAKYSYKAKTKIKIGNGAGNLTYKTHHGDIYIKQSNSNG